jgi:cytochrome P450
LFSLKIADRLFILLPITRALLAWTQSNVTAGSDTTAIVLRTIFYNLLRYPETLEALMAELRKAADDGELSPVVTWKQSQRLPYLKAVVKEAGRIHPPFGLPLERIVPEGGAEICGRFFDEGTIVGMNAWVVYRNTETFGEDADIWRPERWLTSDREAVKNMENALLTVCCSFLSLDSWFTGLSTKPSDANLGRSF